MNPLDLKSLKAKAKAATSGPWFSGKWGGVYDKPHGKHNRVISQNSGDDAQGVADDVFVSAASPDVVLSLIERIETMRKALETIASFERPEPGLDDHMNALAREALKAGESK